MRHGRNGEECFIQRDYCEQRCRAGTARQEPDPQELQVSTTREETGSEEARRAAGATTDSEAVGLSPSGRGTQGETRKTFRGETAGSDPGSAGRRRPRGRPGCGASAGLGADEVRSRGNVNGDATKRMGASRRDPKTAQEGNGPSHLLTSC